MLSHYVFYSKKYRFLARRGGDPFRTHFSRKIAKTRVWTLICGNGRKKCLFVKKMHFAAKIWGDQGAKRQRGENLGTAFSSGKQGASAKSNPKPAAPRQARTNRVPKKASFSRRKPFCNAHLLQKRAPHTRNEITMELVFPTFFTI